MDFKSENCQFTIHGWKRFAFWKLLFKPGATGILVQKANWDIPFFEQRSLLKIVFSSDMKQKQRKKSMFCNENFPVKICFKSII